MTTLKMQSVRTKKHLCMFCKNAVFDFVCFFTQIIWQEPGLGFNKLECVERFSVKFLF